MELFTLGIGHYTEPDVKEAARALTGWTVADGEFRDVRRAARRRRQDDPRPARAAGRAPTWSRILLEHPATAERLAWRLCEPFLGEGAVDDAGVDGAGRRPAARTISTSAGPSRRSSAREPSSPPRTSARACSSPVEFVIGAARALELFDPPPSTLVLADWSARLGQDLFYPPNVGGWPGGRSWLSAAVADRPGQLRRGPRRGPRRRPRRRRSTRSRWPAATAAAGDRDDAIALLRRAARWAPSRTATGTRGSPAAARRRTSRWDPDAARRAVALILASPRGPAGLTPTGLDHDCIRRRLPCSRDAIS